MGIDNIVGDEIGFVTGGDVGLARECWGGIIGKDKTAVDGGTIV